ncbi:MULTISPECIES: retron St85 family effector protein [unclassified Sphingomonas]|uniref:retron St85 family effector protein n=1 Tax=unclassified Sphingomonas TaxID=196159 RepID=UPI00226A3A3C|nr:MULTISPECIES: retron St85 family effector protein [unclassified Sphingomonas]
MLTAFHEHVDVSSVRVYPPRRVVLLCGGEVSNAFAKSPRSLRDAFLLGDGISMRSGVEFLQVEEVQEFFDKDSPYKDLVKFETDLAQVCELVILFSESPGSFVELGSFAAVEEISEKLLVIIQSKFLGKSSFISKGPILTLRRDYPNSVFTFADASIGMVNGQFDGVDSAALVAKLVTPFNVRIDEVGSRTTFDKTKFNHICKIYVGILREAYALKDDEICLLFGEFGIDMDEPLLDRVAFCCSALRWASSTRSGFDRVHFAYQNENEATKFTFAGPLKEKLRRRAEFRKFWEDFDMDRVAAVDQVIYGK